jgi:pimeloyl-ACP methyl ester carboxylesterase
LCWVPRAYPVPDQRNPARAGAENRREQILAATPEQFAEQLESLLSPVDAKVLTGDLVQWLTETHKIAPSADDQGCWDDGAAHLAGGLISATSGCPSNLAWPPDRFVPVQHGQWLAASIPGAEAEISDRDGHLTMIGRADEIHTGSSSTSRKRGLVRRPARTFPDHQPCRWRSPAACRRPWCRRGQPGTTRTPGSPG